MGKRNLVITKDGKIRPMKAGDIDEVARLRRERDIYGCALLNIATITSSLKAVKYFAKSELDRGLQCREPLPDPPKEEKQ